MYILRIFRVDMDPKLSSKLSIQNRNFLRSIKTDNIDAHYVIKDVLNDTLFEVVSVDHPEKRLMMKLLNMTTSTSNFINLTLNAVESVYNFLGRDCAYHNRFLCYKDFFMTTEGGNIYFVSIYERVDGIPLGELEQEFINKEEDIPLGILINVGFSLLTSLFILHSNGIIHRDIKPENIIYDPREGWSSRVKIIDFDFSCSGGGACTGLPGTRVYAAKAVLKSRKSLPDNVWAKTDIVSLAISLFKLLTTDDIDESYFKIDEKIPFGDEEAMAEWIVGRSLNRDLEGDDLQFAYFLVNLFDYDTNEDKSHISLLDIINMYTNVFGEYIDESLIYSFKSIIG